MLYTGYHYQSNTCSAMTRPHSSTLCDTEYIIDSVARISQQYRTTIVEEARQRSKDQQNKHGPLVEIPNNFAQKGVPQEAAPWTRGISFCADLPNPGFSETDLGVQGDQLSVMPCLHLAGITILSVHSTEDERDFYYLSP